MWAYEKKLQYPVNIKNKNLKLAKLMMAQYGGGNSELAAALRYLNQRYTMPDEKGKNLLTDIATEEIGHVEIMDSIIYQLMEGASIEEIKKEGMADFYAEHGNDLYPVNPSGVPFTVTYFSSVGDPLANLSEDMAAEEKARAVYENLIDLTDDPDVLAPLNFLRQREIVHFTRFKELYDYYKNKGIK